MNGRFLNVRPYDSDRAGPIKFGNPSIFSRSEHSVDRTRRSSESTFTKCSQIVSLDYFPGHQSRQLPSRTGEHVQTSDAALQSISVGNDSSGDNCHPIMPKVEKAFEEPYRDDCVKAIQVSSPPDMNLVTATAHPCTYHSSEELTSNLKVMEGHSAASTGSPVKRVKRKGATTPKAGQSKTKDFTKTPLKQLANNRPAALENELQDLAVETAEARAGHPGPSKASSVCAVVDSIQETRDNFADAKGSARQQHEVQSRKAKLICPSRDDLMHHSTENAGRSTTQSSQTKVPLEEAFESHNTSVHLPHSPNAPGNTALQSLEAKSPEQTCLTPSVAKTEILLRDFLKDREGARYPSTSASPHKISTDANERQLAAEASQRQFAAGLVQTQSKGKNSKQKGKGSRPSTTSKAIDQQSSVKTQAPEKADYTKKGRVQHRSNETKTAGHLLHATAQNLLSQSIPPPAIGAQRPPPLDTNLATSAQKNVLSWKIDEDLFSTPMTGSRSTEGTSSSTNSALPTTPPTTGHTTERSNSREGGHDSSTEIDVTLKAYNYGKTASATGLDAAHLRSKTESTDMRTQDAPQPVETAVDQTSPYAQLYDLDLPEARSPPKGKRNDEENTSILSKGQPEKLPLIGQQKNKSAGSDLTIQTRIVESKGTDRKDKKLGLDFGKSHTGNEKWSTAPPKELNEERARLENTTLNDRSKATTLRSSRRSPDQQEKLPVPPRSNPIVQSPTPAPIVARKKKQKKFPQMTQGSEELDAPRRTRIDEAEKRVEDNLASILPEGSKSDKACNSSADYPFPGMLTAR